MKQIPLMGDKTALVDDEDFEALSCHQWTACARYKTSTWYAIRRGRKNGRCVIIYMHKVLLSVAKGLTVDHRDGNGLNNQKGNLRSATRHQQQFNRPPRKESSTGIKGVFPRRDGKWYAKIKHNKRELYLGSYDNQKDAARAYNTKALELFGEFAWLNPVPEVAQ